MANNTCARPPALYQGDGSTTKYSFAFQYIETSDIAVFLWNETTETFDLCTQVSNSAACSGSTTEYYFTSATPVDLRFCVAPPEPPENRPPTFSNVIIIRQTDICQMVAYFYPGSPVRAQDLNNNFTQILLALQDVEGRLYQFIENYQGFVRINGDTMEGGPLDMNTFQLTGIPDPVDGTDAVPFDWAEKEYINADGDTMRGTLNMNGKDLTGVPYPSVDSDAANKKYVDDLDDELRDWAEDTFVNVTGDRMTGALTMSGEHVKEVRWPVDSDDAVNKAYVDSILVGSGGNISSLPVVRAIFTARGGETVLDPMPPIAPGNEIVTVNGSTLTPNDDYTIQGEDTVTLRMPLLEGDVVMILCYNSLKVVEVESNFETYPFTRWVGTATAGQTVFQGVGDGTVTLGYSVGYEQVTLNGSRLTRDVDYTANDKLSVILVQGALEGDVLEVLCGNYLKTGDQESYAASDISYTYPGGVSSNVQARLEQYVSVKDFGAKGDGKTDDTDAIQAALNSDTDKVILPHGQYLVNSADLTLPINTALVVLGATAPDTTSRYTIPEQTCLILGNNKTINLENNAGLKGITIIQEVTFRALDNLSPGQVLDISDVNNYSGTAIVSNACSYVGYCNIFGFNQGLTTLSSNTPRGRLEYLMFDCINGVEIDNDLGGWDLYSCHSYAMLTTGDANNIRSGVGFRFKNYSDWTYVTNCFSFNDIGFRIENSNAIKFMGCGADHPRTPKGVAGFDIQGASWGNLFIGCQTASQTSGFRVATTNGNRNMLTGCALWGCIDGINLAGGSINVSGTIFKDIDSHGILVNDAASRILVDGCQFQEMPTAISTSAYLEVLTSNNEYLQDVDNVRTGEATKAITLSSSNLTLPSNDTLLEINNGGQAVLGTLIGQTRDPGSVLILKFNGALTLNHSSTGMNLAGSVHATMTAGSTITLLYVTANIWYELSRSMA